MRRPSDRHLRGFLRFPPAVPGVCGSAAVSEIRMSRNVARSAVPLRFPAVPTCCGSRAPSLGSRDRNRRAVSRRGAFLSRLVPAGPRHAPSGTSAAADSPEEHRMLLTADCTNHLGTGPRRKGVRSQGDVTVTYAAWSLAVPIAAPRTRRGRVAAGGRS